MVADNLSQRVVRKPTTYSYIRSITPSDSVNLPNGVCGCVYVGGSGNVVVVDETDTATTLTAVPTGAYIPVAAKRINATSTTATNLVAFY